MGEAGQSATWLICAYLLNVIPTNRLCRRCLHSPLGIILSAGKQQEQIELLGLDNSGIHVAEYLTVLPSWEVLQAKLHQSIESALARLSSDQVC